MSPVAAPAQASACMLYLRQRPQPDATLPQRGAGQEPLVALARTALQDWPVERRVVLQAEGGLLVAGEVAPVVALAAARRALEQRGGLPLSLVLHQGPVKALRESDGRSWMAGEALETAATLARAGHDGVLASEAFRAALAQQAPDEAAAFRPLADPALRAHGPQRFDPALARRRSTRRTVLGIGGLFALLGAGIAGRIARERYEAAHRPAVLLLDIKPAGEVFVDGVSKGMAPPLTRVSVPPGAHSLEVRSGRLKPFRLEVMLKPGQEMEIRHVFVTPPPPRRAPPPPKQKPGPFERFKFW